MKKSTAYYTAQLAVLADELISSNEKLDILRVLMDAEDVAKFTEKAASGAEAKA